MLAVALALAVLGWVASSRTEVVSDIRELAPSSLPALQDVNALQDETGVSGEVNVVVRSDDLADPAVIAWISDFQRRVLADAGYEGERPSCEQARLCPAISLTDLFSGGAAVESEAQAQALLASIPPYFSQAVVTRDPKTGGIGDTANIAFGIRVQPLDEQQDLIDRIREQIEADGRAAAGHRGRAGRAAGDRGRGQRRPLAQPLLAPPRRPRRRGAGAAGDLPLAAAGAGAAGAGRARDRLVCSGGGRDQRAAEPDVGDPGGAGDRDRDRVQRHPRRPLRARAGEGLSVGEALRRTYALTGTAVLASGVTAIAGFAALAATDIRMLRDFGLVTVADLSVALVGVMLVLPATLVWADQRFSAGPRRRAVEGFSAEPGR